MWWFIQLVFVPNFDPYLCSDHISAAPLWIRSTMIHLCMNHDVDHHAASELEVLSGLRPPEVGSIQTVLRVFADIAVTMMIII